MLSLFMCFSSKFCPRDLVAEYHYAMLIVDKHCSDVCCADEFLLPQIDRKSKQVKEQ